MSSEARWWGGSEKPKGGGVGLEALGRPAGSPGDTRKGQAQGWRQGGLTGLFLPRNYCDPRTPTGWFPCLARSARVGESGSTDAPLRPFISQPERLLRVLAVRVEGEKNGPCAGGRHTLGGKREQPQQGKPATGKWNHNQSDRMMRWEPRAVRVGRRGRDNSGTS